MAAVKSQPLSRSGQTGDQPGFEQALKIDGHLIPIPDQVQDARDLTAETSRIPFPPSGLHGHDTVQARNQLEDLPAALFDHPGDPRIREGGTQRGKGRQGVNDVAQGADPDDEDLIHA